MVTFHFPSFEPQNGETSLKKVTHGTVLHGIYFIFFRQSANAPSESQNSTLQYSSLWKSAMLNAQVEFVAI